MNIAGGAHKLGPVDETTDEAKKRLESNRKHFKRRQEEVGDEKKKYKELLRQLETEYNNTMEEMRRHKEEQVSESCHSLYCTVSAATIM